jgi:hypothetical protein
VATERRFDWRLFIWGLAILGVAGVGTLALSVDWYGGGIGAEVGWPSKLSWHEKTALPVSVTDDHGHPLAGASVEVGYTRAPDDEELAVADEYEQGFEAVASAETNTDGDAWVSVPPVESLVDAAPADLEADDLTLLMQVRHGLKWTTPYQAVPLEAPVRMTLSTDRPLYRPGQSVRMRGLVLESGGGGPYEPATTEAGAAADLEVEGPEGTVLYREHPLVSEHGVVEATFPLADEARSGTYTATISVAGGEVTREIEVRPYEKPRFQVDLAAGMERDGKIHRVSGDVRAEYVYGEPVADGEVEVRIEPSGDWPDETEGVEEKRLEGRLDADGGFAFAESVRGIPPLTGGAWRVTAAVETPSGERRETTTRLTDNESGFQIEVWPADRTRFRETDEHEAVVAVRDRHGDPVEGAELRVYRGASEDPVASGLTSDANGRVSFDWKSASPDRRYASRGQADFRVEGSTADDRSIEAQTTVELADDGRALITPSDPMPRVGDSVSFTVDVPAAGQEFGSSVPVAAIDDGRPVATKTFEIGDEASADGELQMPRSARGLTYLVAFDKHGRENGWTAIWVRQKRGDNVGVAVDGQDHRPGEMATVSLAYPAGEGRTDEDGKAQADAAGETTFGLRAVDEALYALVEGTELPIHVLATQPADAAEAAARASETAKSAGGDTPNLQAARMNRAAGPPTLSYSAGHSGVDNELNSRLRSNWSVIWLVALLSLIVVLFIDATRLLWRHFEFGRAEAREAVTLIVAFLTLAGATFLIAEAFGDGGLRFLVGLEVLATLVCLGVGLWNRSELPYGRWLGTFLVVLALAGIAGTSFENVSRSSAAYDPLGFAGIAVGGVVIVTMSLQFLFWAVIFFRRRRYVAAGGTFTAVCLAGLVFVANIFGEEVDEKFQKAGSGVESQVQFGSTGSGPEAASPGALDETGESPSRADRASGTNGSESDDETTVREEFPDTAIWRPEIVADDGRAEVDVELPDSITTWRLHAVAHTDDGAVAGGQTELEVDKPFFAELELPGRLTRGDELELPVVLVDGRDEPNEPLTAEMDVEASGGLTAEAADRRVEIPSEGRTVVRVEARAEEHGEGGLTIRAEPTGASGDRLEGDAVRRTTRIVPDGRRRTKVAASIIGEGWETRVDLPDATLPGTASSRLRILPDQLGIALDGVGSMLGRPNGCFEQTTSTAFPNAMVLKALEQVGSEKWSGGAEEWKKLHSKARRLVDEGYQKIVRFQNDDGGFGPYQHRPSEMTTTAYGLLQVGQMAEAHDAVTAASTIRRAAGWLADRQEPSGGWNGPHLTELQATSLAVWGLGAAPGTDRPETLSSGVRALKQLTDAQTVDPLGKALAANALLAADETDRADILLDELADGAKADGKMRYWDATMDAWTGESGQGADTLATALAARAFAIRDTGPKFRRGAAAYLADRRIGNGGWSTTQTTVWSIDAFSKLKGPGQGEPTRLEIEADGEPMARSDGKPDGRLRVIPGRTVPTGFGPRTLAAGSHTFAVSAEKPTGALAQVTTEYVVSWNSDEARTDHPQLKVAPAFDRAPPEVGERMPVTVSVANRDESRAGATLVKLPVPPGSWADTGELEAMVEEGTLDRIEQTSNRVVVYVPELEGGEEVELDYAFVPQIPGRVELPPTVAYPYYNPQPHAVTPGTTLNVRK